MSSDPIVLSTVFAVMALSLQYLPSSHPILPFLPDSASVLSDQYYNLSVAALARYKVDKRTPTLELVELLLLRTHYLSICRNDCEEIWTIRSELISAGTAMGLHRDPGKWKMSRELVDRRRWAWWNIMVMERCVLSCSWKVNYPSDKFYAQLASIPLRSAIGNSESPFRYAIPNERLDRSKRPGLRGPRLTIPSLIPTSMVNRRHSRRRSISPKRSIFAHSRTRSSTG